MTEEHDSDPEDLEEEELFVFKINIANQHASWPATKWSAFACILSVCLAAVAIAGLWFYAPTANVEVMGNMFSDKPAAARAAMAARLKGEPIE